MSTGEDVGRVAAEARARVLIDRQFADAGWSVQDKKAMDLFAVQWSPSAKSRSSPATAAPTTGSTLISASSG